MIRDKFWFIIRLLSLIAFLGFIYTGVLFALKPEIFTGRLISPDSAFWHSLALAFMATVSVLALLVTINPKKYLDMLLPLAIGKFVSSFSSLYWYIHFNVNFLMFNVLTDGIIALIALILYSIVKIHKL
ncbi:MAG: hypothetical protein QW128_02110 [Thermoprotei archaeon]